MSPPGDVSPTRRAGLSITAGGFVAVGAAVALFTRFGINGLLSRDEAIYTYGGQQLAHGVAPYASIFDPKTPLSTIIAGGAAGLAHAVDRNDIYAIRAAFFVCSCLTVLAVYVLALRLFRSVAAGVVAAIVFTSFTGFAQDALSGPDAKTPGILLAVLAMWLTLERRWVVAAVAGSLAFLVWQPLLIYPVVTVVVAALSSDQGGRRRAAGFAAVGAGVPIVATVIGFAAGGALDDLVNAAFVFPATDVIRAPVTFTGRFTRIADVIHASYGVSGVLLWVGLAAVAICSAVHVVRRRRDVTASLRDPLVSVVLVTGLVEMAYAIYDFQGYPDVYPLLPYGALGLGALTALITRTLSDARARRAVTAGALAAVTVLAGFSWTWYGDAPDKGMFRDQRASACAVERLLGSTGHLYALGNPAFVALTHRRNPDQFLYLGSGVDEWKIDHTTGGFGGWVAQVLARQPAVIPVGGWFDQRKDQMIAALRAAGYRARYAGTWRLLLSPATLAAAPGLGVHLTRRPPEFGSVNKCPKA